MPIQQQATMWSCCCQAPHSPPPLRPAPGLSNLTSKHAIFCAKRHHLPPKACIAQFLNLQPVTRKHSFSTNFKHRQSYEEKKIVL